MIFGGNVDKNQKKVLKKLYKRAFTQLFTISYLFQAKIDESQPAFLEVFCLLVFFLFLLLLLGQSQ